MNKKDILYWCDKYNKEEDAYNKGVEQEIGKRIGHNQYIDKNDLEKIIKWKFQGRLAGRQKRILKLILPISDSFIISCSKKAFRLKADDGRIEALREIKGVGISLSSVILSFYDPANYGIFDIHAWRQLFGKEPKNLFNNPKYLIQFFNALRVIMKKTGINCRDVEKALFKKDIEQKS